MQAKHYTNADQTLYKCKPILYNYRPNTTNIQTKYYTNAYRNAINIQAKTYKAIDQTL